MKTKLIIILISLALCGTVYATDFYVGTVATLTNAVAQATNGDTVWVSNGTYACTSPMVADSFLNVGAGVTVKSISGLPANVILNGGYPTVTNRVVLMADGSAWLIGVTVTNGSIGSDLGDDGGGVKRGAISNCIIIGNTTAFFAGGVSEVTIYNSIIAYNSSGIMGAGGGGGGAYFNCTVYGNTTTGNGGGLNNCTVINSISWGNNKIDDSITESYSCGVGYTGTGSITNNPLFVSATDFHLQEGSPARDAGTNGAWIVNDSTDLGGDWRVRNAVVDMGAYEYQFGSTNAAPLKATSPVPVDVAISQPADITLHWADGGRASGYQVSFGVSNSMADHGAVSTTNYAVNGLLRTNSYQWRIDATNLHGTATGDVWSFTVTNYPPIINIRGGSIYTIRGVGNTIRGQVQ